MLAGPVGWPCAQGWGGPRLCTQAAAAVTPALRSAGCGAAPGQGPGAAVRSAAAGVEAIQGVGPELTAAVERCAAGGCLVRSQLQGLGAPRVVGARPAACWAHPAMCPATCLRSSGRRAMWLCFCRPSTAMGGKAGMADWGASSLSPDRPGH